MSESVKVNDANKPKVPLLQSDMNKDYEGHKFEETKPPLLQSDMNKEYEGHKFDENTGPLLNLEDHADDHPLRLSDLKPAGLELTEKERKELFGKDLKAKDTKDALTLSEKDVKDLNKEKDEEDQKFHLDKQGRVVRGSHKVDFIKRKNKKQKRTVMTRMDRYAQIDKYHPDNRPFKAIQDFEGPTMKRRCTNCVFWILPYLFFAALFFTWFWIYLQSNISVLTHPMDFRAQMCGIEPFENKTFLYYLTPSIDINVTMCVNSCPNTTGSSIC